MAKSDGIGVIGRLMSQDPVATKSETVGNKVGKSQRQQNIACKKSSHDAQNSDDESQEEIKNELPVHLGQHESNPYESWRPPWKKKVVCFQLLMCEESCSLRKFSAC